MANKTSVLAKLNTNCSQYTQVYNDWTTIKFLENYFSETQFSTRVTSYFSPTYFVNTFSWNGISMMIDKLCLLNVDVHLYQLIKLLERSIPRNIDPYLFQFMNQIYSATRMSVIVFGTCLLPLATKELHKHYPRK